MKKHIFFSIKLWKVVVIILAVMFIFVGVVMCGYITNVAYTKPHYYTIVIDPGHGGRDVGCSGVSTGVKESDINLAIAKILKTKLEDYGFRVVLTRSGDYGLYDASATNFKLSDMNKRVELIKNEKADMVISIHQNSFSDSSLKGAQVFYQEGDIKGERLASAINQELECGLGRVRGEHNFSDLYLLKEAGVLGALVECGYLTNIEEELCLMDDYYQKKVAYAIVAGVIRYLVFVGEETY